jgi:hypothetical protein
MLSGGEERLQKPVAEEGETEAYPKIPSPPTVQ